MKRHLAVMFALMLAACKSGSDELILADSSPDGVFDAVLLKSGFGATAAPSYSLHLLSASRPDASPQNLVTKVADLNCFQFAWHGNRVLEVAVVGRVLKQTSTYKSGTEGVVRIVSQDPALTCSPNTRLDRIYAPRED